MGKLFGWITANPLFAGVIALAVAGAIAAGVAIWNRESDKRDAAQVKTGVQEERLKHNEEVIENVEKARDAVTNPQPDDVERMRSKYDRSRRQDSK